MKILSLFDGISCGMVALQRAGIEVDACMKKEYEQVITNILGVEPITINSSLLSAQNRTRLYWTNIPDILQPEDKNIMLADILEENNGEYPLSVQHYKAFIKSYPKWKDSPVDGKAKTLLASYYKQPPHCPYVRSEKTESGYRMLSPIECERLQTLPDGYTEGISKCGRYKALGNAWTVDVIAHILRHIPKK